MCMSVPCQARIPMFGRHTGDAAETACRGQQGKRRTHDMHCSTSRGSAPPSSPSSDRPAPSRPPSSTPSPAPGTRQCPPSAPRSFTCKAHCAMSRQSCVPGTQCHHPHAVRPAPSRRRLRSRWLRRAPPASPLPAPPPPVNPDPAAAGPSSAAPDAMMLLACGARPASSPAVCPLVFVTAWPG